MSCPRCVADPHPPNSGARKCAFDGGGIFTGDNWRCATLEALMEISAVQDHIFIQDSAGPVYLYGEDETMAILPCKIGPDGPGGWIVLNRYKSRGRWSSAIHVGDHPFRAVTIGLVEQTIEWFQTGRR
jgi:hypothetical protein